MWRREFDQWALFKEDLCQQELGQLVFILLGILRIYLSFNKDTLSVAFSIKSTSAFDT